MLKRLLLICVIGLCNAREQNVLLTEVFEVIVDPPMFNWTYEGRRDQYEYVATLLNLPGLPSWIHYVYSDRLHSGLLYGIAPNRDKPVVPLEIVALNRKDYETRIERLNIIISEKLNPATHEVHMKIDNLDVQDMFEVERMEALKDIFRRNLWKDSEEDLYVTFLESAIEMGARKPLDPREREGVVVGLGSEVIFSSQLLELQEEVRPLYKWHSCPRDFKRTSVERFFRDAGFILDWCSFKLIQKDENNRSAIHKLNNEPTDGDFNLTHNDGQHFFSRRDIPARTYTRELIITITVPMFIMVILIIGLTFLLCFDRDDMRDEASDFFFDNLYHICTDCYAERFGLSEETVLSTQKQSSAQRFLTSKTLADDLRGPSVNREQSLSPDPVLACLSRADSPSSTMTRGVHCRPSPPPYVRPKFKPEL